MVLPRVGGDDTLTSERDGKRVEVTLKFGCGRGGQAEDLKLDRSILADKAIDQRNHFFDCGRKCVRLGLRVEKPGCP